MEKDLCPAITTSAGLSRNGFHNGKTLNIFLCVAMIFHNYFIKIHKTITLPVAVYHNEMQSFMLRQVEHNVIRRTLKYVLKVAGLQPKIWHHQIQF
jgi:hypothetical protein